METETTRSPGPMKLIVIAFLTLAVAVGSAFAVLAVFGPRPALADDARTSTELKLSAGQKLVDVSWRCFGDYPCRPFVLTRAMRKDEASETYTLSSPYSDAMDAYVIKESR